MQQGGEGKISIEAAGDEAACHELACNQKQMWGCCTRENKPGGGGSQPEVIPAQAMTLLTWVQTPSIRAVTEAGPDMEPHA